LLGVFAKEFVKPNNSLKFLKYLELMIHCIWSFQIFTIEDSLNLTFFFKYLKVVGITKKSNTHPHIGGGPLKFYTSK
jgi:hypothetical protein